MCACGKAFQPQEPEPTDPPITLKFSTPFGAGLSTAPSAKATLPLTIVSGSSWASLRRPNNELRKRRQAIRVRVHTIGSRPAPDEPAASRWVDDKATQSASGRRTAPHRRPLSGSSSERPVSRRATGTADLHYVSNVLVSTIDACGQLRSVVQRIGESGPKGIIGSRYGPSCAVLPDPRSDIGPDSLRSA